MKERRKRPFGLNAIIVMQVLTVLFAGALLALLGVAVYLAATESALADEMAQSIQICFDNLPALLFTFVINLLCAVGLWRRQRWAWYLTMLQVGVFMLEDLHAWFTGAEPVEYVWSMLINVIMVFYLNQREVQAVFQRKGAGDPVGSLPPDAHTPSPLPTLPRGAQR